MIFVTIENFKLKPRDFSCLHAGFSLELCIIYVFGPRNPIMESLCFLPTQIQIQIVGQPKITQIVATTSRQSTPLPTINVGASY